MLSRDTRESREMKHAFTGNALSGENSSVPLRGNPVPLDFRRMTNRNRGERSRWFLFVIFSALCEISSMLRHAKVRFRGGAVSTRPLLVIGRCALSIYVATRREEDFRKVHGISSPLRFSAVICGTFPQASSRFHGRAIPERDQEATFESLA